MNGANALDALNHPFAYTAHLSRSMSSVVPGVHDEALRKEVAT